MQLTHAPGFLRISLAAAMLAALTALAGCGGSGNGGTGGTTSAGGGRTLFVEYCGSCHALAAAGTSGISGPDLDQARPSYDLLVEKATNGGSTMPAFAGTLTRAQIRAIARYAAAAAGPPASGQ